MPYEYKVVPAPEKGTKARGVKTPESRFALTLQDLMNAMAEEGWEFQRAETLPSVERSGLTSSNTVFRNLLVFRRSAQSPQQIAEAYGAEETTPAPAASEHYDEPSREEREQPEDDPENMPV